jgi:hypothetical protein
MIIKSTYLWDVIPGCISEGGTFQVNRNQWDQILQEQTVASKDKDHTPYIGTHEE